MELAIINHARQLANIKSIQDGLEKLDQMEIMKSYHKRYTGNLEEFNQCAVNGFYLQRGLANEVNEGQANGLIAKIGNPQWSHNGTIGFSDLGIHKRDVKRWRQVLAISEDIVIQYAVQTHANNEEVTTAGLLRYAKELSPDNKEVIPVLGEAYQRLKNDIKENGQYQSIWLHPEGAILDGRNRWRAIQDINSEDEIEISPKFETYSGDLSLSALASFVWSANTQRKQYSKSQLACAVINREELVGEEEEKARQRYLATLKQNQTTAVAIVPQRENGRSRARVG